MDQFYEMYRSDLEKITPCTQEELTELSKDLEMGDETVRNRFIEGNLHLVIEIAKEYENRGVGLSDLVQEGNVALTMAVYEYEGGNIRPYLIEKIEQAIQFTVQEQKNSEQTAEKMAAYLNVMDEVTKRLAEEFGRQATAEEVAEKMQLSVGEVKELMKIALNAVNYEK